MLFTEKNLIKLAKEWFKTLEPYESSANILQFNIDDPRYTRFVNILNNSRELLQQVATKNNVKQVSPVQIASARFSNHVACQELVNLCAIKICQSGIKEYEVVRVTKNRMNHCFLVINSCDGVGMAIDPYFNLVCPEKEIYSNKKFMEYFEEKSPGILLNKLNIKRDTLVVITNEDDIKAINLLVSELVDAAEKQEDESLKNKKNLLLKLKEDAMKYYKNNAFDKAAPCFLNIVNILQSLSEDVFSHKKRIEYKKELATAQYNLGSSYFSSGHCEKEKENTQGALAAYKKAKEHLEQAVIIREKLLGIDHELTKKVQDKLDSCNKAMSADSQIQASNSLN